MFKAAIARIFGNAGMFFVTPYVGSGVATGVGVSQTQMSIETASIITMIGLILSTSRELIEYGKQREM
jgi:hypothetical protein